MTWSNFGVEGGSFVEVLVGFLLATTTIAVGVWVAIVAYRGYTQSENPSTLFLASGVALASSGYIGIRILVPTAGGSSLMTDAVAAGIQILGLSLILYAVYGHPGRRTRHVLGWALGGALLVFILPFALVEATGTTPATASAVANGLTAVLGGFIMIQALRGYARYGTPSMQWLAIGIALLTVVPFLVLELLTVFRSVVGVSDAGGLSLVLFTEVVGVTAILVSLKIE